MKPLKISIFTAGYCSCPEHIAINGGRYKNIHFPAMFALIEHPLLGSMLFDTGYSEQFFSETKRFPAKLYRMMTPVTLQEEDLAVNQLFKINILPTDITKIFISHFHADHISALGDFPKAKFIYLPHAYQAVKKINGIKALSQAYLPGLLPNDFAERSNQIKISRPVLLPPELLPFTHGFDVLGDNSLIAVELPGHAIGQMGIFCRNIDNKMYFFVADAAWLKQSITHNKPSHWVTNFIFSDSKTYRNTLAKIHNLSKNSPDFEIIPSHCEETLKKYSH